MPSFYNKSGGQAEYVEYSDTSKGVNVTAGKVIFSLGKPGENQTLRDLMESIHTNLMAAFHGTTFLAFDPVMDSCEKGKETCSIEFRSSSVLPIETVFGALQKAGLAKGGYSEWMPVSPIKKRD